MIPRIIHYCWLSKDPWNETHHRCFESWQKNLPGYEFRKWDLSSFPAKASKFYRKMVQGKNWSFASDYVRLFALYHYGGIYLDMDVEVFKTFDTLLKNRVFLGLEDTDEKYLGGHLIGAEPNHPFIGQCLDYYDNSWKLNWSFPPTIPRILTRIATEAYGYKKPEEPQAKVFGDELTVYPTFCFSPLSYKNKKDLHTNVTVSEQTYALHHWLHSWSWFGEGFRGIRKIPWLFMGLSEWKYVIKKLIIR